ncbi:unnamed protein product [Effrenium voratum]|nr:unnamed protein product [Effrenium voratum]
MTTYAPLMQSKDEVGKFVPPSDEYVKAHSTPTKMPESCTCSDVYSLVLTAILGVPMVVLGVVIAILLTVPLFIIYLYKCTLSRPLDLVPRTCGFYMMCGLVFPLSLPAVILALVWVLVVRIFTWICCFPVALCNWSRTRRSWQALRPYSARPGQLIVDSNGAQRPDDALSTKFGYIWPFSDVITAIIGSMDRQGFGEFFVALPVMFTVLPIYKHTILTNALLFDLQDVYINQWSDPLDANLDGRSDCADIASIKEHMKIGICRAMLTERNRDFIDPWQFTGHHQYPPPGRESQTVGGMQFSNQGPLRVCLLSHTCVAIDIPNHKPRSETAAWTLLEVHLLSWNPWYQLAGIVEVNFRKDGGVEHPMWLAMDPNSYIAVRALHLMNVLFATLGLRTASWLKDIALRDKKP